MSFGRWTPASIGLIGFGGNKIRTEIHADVKQSATRTHLCSCIHTADGNMAHAWNSFVLTNVHGGGGVPHMHVNFLENEL